MKADSDETSRRRSSTTRATKESKDVEVPNRFRNRVASVSPSVEGFRRSVDSAVEADRPFFYFDADDQDKRATKATMTRCLSTRLTSTRADGLVTAGRTDVAMENVTSSWRLYDIMSTFYNVEHKF